ncbi:uncharacterized protein LOC122947110 [Acropora millepora]|uniref:uncharacterized protein LOC122947110 n=1 Tax=Acropora millepora TaxID=45264 RepID=UPI001CF2A33E|nr:uncharacterized protein LOC122947110 [Acropora millepora]
MCPGKISASAAIGSIPEVPAESCNEVKKSEKGRDGKYWLLSVIPGTPVYAYCNMTTGDVDECTASTPVCDLHFNCTNTLGCYRCEYNHSCCQGNKSIHQLFILMINLFPGALEKPWGKD